MDQDGKLDRILEGDLVWVREIKDNQHEANDRLGKLEVGSARHDERLASIESKIYDKNHPRERSVNPSAWSVLLEVLSPYEWHIIIGSITTVATIILGIVFRRRV